MPKSSYKGPGVRTGRDKYNPEHANKYDVNRGMDIDYGDTPLTRKYPDNPRILAPHSQGTPLHDVGTTPQSLKKGIFGKKKK